MGHKQTIKAGEKNMLAKIGTILYLIAAVLHFINGQMALLGLTVVLGIITFGLSAYISYPRVSPELREYREVDEYISYARCNSKFCIIWNWGYKINIDDISG